jgi:hypothetical protein
LSDTPYQLFADLFAEEDRADLANFDCGNDSWAEAATEWIQGSDVVESITKRKTRVWLYRNEQDVVIGFGSLGLTRRQWPPPDGDHANLQIIPMVGLDYRHHGKPPDPNWRYSRQIISHLRHEAISTLADHFNARKSTLPLLTLYVHQDNAAAITLYQRFGFTPEPAVRRGDHILMLQRLNVGE